jgi:YgiT-type zinc finger domain-containing protein
MNKQLCPICKGSKQKATTTFSVDIGSGVVVVRNVPSLICSQCGEEWISDSVSEKLEQIVELSRKEKREIEVLSYATAA